MTTTDNNSLLASLHHLVYARLPRAQRPGDPPKALRVINLVAAALFTGVTLRAAGWQRGPPAAAEPYRRRAERSEVIFVGLLIQLMLLFSPVTHLHYFALWLPLVMGLLAADRERRGSPGIGRGLLGLLGLVTGMNALPRFPKLPPFHGNNPVRDLAGGMYGSLLLWVVGVVILWKQTDSETRSSAGDETR